MANGSRHSMRYVAESTYGQTPATPAFKPIRHTGTTLGLSKESLQSEEIRSDRQIADFRHGAYQVGGDINIELSYGSFDKLLEAVLCGTWQIDSPAAGTDRLKAGTVRRSFTIERFFGVLLEHYAGAFPAWLAPVQVLAVPVAEPFNDYLADVVAQLKLRDGVAEQAVQQHRPGADLWP